MPTYGRNILALVSIFIFSIRLYMLKQFEAILKFYCKAAPGDVTYHLLHTCMGQIQKQEDNKIVFVCILFFFSLMNRHGEKERKHCILYQIWIV